MGECMPILSYVYGLLTTIPMPPILFCMTVNEPDTLPE